MSSSCCEDVIGNQQSALRQVSWADKDFQCGVVQGKRCIDDGVGTSLAAAN